MKDESKFSFVRLPEPHKDHVRGYDAAKYSVTNLSIACMSSGAPNPMLLISGVVSQITLIIKRADSVAMTFSAIQF